MILNKGQWRILCEPDKCIVIKILIRKILFTLSVLFLLIQWIAAQDIDYGFKFDLSVRYRFESWNGLNAQNYGNDGHDAIGNLNDKIVLQRIIPGLTYTRKKITAAIHIQDSRAFGWSLRQNKYPDLYKISGSGTESPYYTMNPQEEYFEIYDLYIEYKELLKNVSVKLGRQKISYGDYRIFSPASWGNTGRWTWDAIKISYKKGDNFIDLFGGGTKTNDPLKISIPFIQTEFWGGGLYAHAGLTDWLEAEPFFALKTGGSAYYINTQSISRNWIGLRLKSTKPQSLIYDLLYAHEFGNENGKRINAFGYAVKTAYRFSFLPAEPSVSLSYSYSSGGKDNDEVIHTFDPAFGARASFYGWMCIASWSNLSNPAMVLEFSPYRNKLWIEMKYNRFYIPEPDDCLILNTMKIMEGSHHLGDEADIYMRYQHNDRWQFIGILSRFNPGDLEQINYKAPEDSFWFGIQVLFTLNDGGNRALLSFRKRGMNFGTFFW